MNALLAPGDLTGDGNVDVLARRRSDGVLLLYPGTGTGGLRSPITIGKGWGVMTSFVSTGDWDLNGTSDFVVRNSAGALLLYSGNAHGWRQLRPHARPAAAGTPTSASPGWGTGTATALLTCWRARATARCGSSRATEPAVSARSSGSAAAGRPIAWPSDPLRHREPESPFPSSGKRRLRLSCVGAGTKRSSWGRNGASSRRY